MSEDEIKKLGVQVKLYCSCMCDYGKTTDTDQSRDWFDGEFETISGEELEKAKAAHAGHELF